VLKPEKVLLHHNNKKEMDDNFVSFFFLVGVMETLGSRYIWDIIHAKTDIEYSSLSI